MHFCGNIWHDALLYGLLALSALPFTRVFVARLKTSLLKKKAPDRGEEEV